MHTVSVLPLRKLSVGEHSQDRELGSLQRVGGRYLTPFCQIILRRGSVLIY